MGTKQSVYGFDLTLMKDSTALWNGNGGLCNPNNYNSEGSFKDTAYFGFQFSDDESPLSYLLGFCME